MPKASSSHVGALVSIAISRYKLSQVSFLPCTMNDDMIYKVPTIESYQEKKKAFLDGMVWKEMPKIWMKGNMFVVIALANVRLWIVYQSKCLESLGCHNVNCLKFQDS